MFIYLGDLELAHTLCRLVNSKCSVWQPKDEGKPMVRFQSEGWQPGDPEDLMVRYEVHRSPAGEFSLVAGRWGKSWSLCSIYTSTD